MWNRVFSRLLPALGLFCSLAQAGAALPITFEANQGQTNSQVKFLSRGRGYTLFLTSTEAVLRLGDVTPVVLRLTPVHANPLAEVSGLAELPGKSNYFIGNDPRKWQRGVSNYARVKYRDIYPGVDLIYYGNERQLEYDFVVRPGADPAKIRLRFQGADRMTVDDRGDLVLRAGGAEVVQHAPRIYQDLDGARQTIVGSYVLYAKDQVGFRLAPYDPARPLVIDPVLSYSTYLGGSGDEGGGRVAVDGAGNAYVAGHTTSLDFPTPVSFSPGRARGDLFVVKLNPSGSALLYATYFGGFQFDTLSDIAVDSSGNAYLAGTTNSTDLPTLNAFQPRYGGGESDAWLAKLDATGSLAYSTYLGTPGGASTGVDTARAIAVDGSGSVYLTGSTGSMGFPTVNPVQPGCAGYIKPFVAKFNPAGSALVYASCFSGGQPGAIAVDASGSAYLTGISLDRGGPSTFVTKLSPAGSAVVYSTDTGATMSDIALDRDGNAYLTGSAGPGFTTVNPLQPAEAGSGDAVVVKLSRSGAKVYATYLGGNGKDSGMGIAVDGSGNIYVAGTTQSTNFPTVSALQPGFGGESDAFLAKLNAAGSALLYSTYLGGSSADEAQDIALDALGNVYVAGLTRSVNFPTARPLQASIGGGADLFLAKIAETASMSPAINAGGTVNGASFTPRAAPGSIVSIFGAQLASGSAAARTIPLPTKMLGAGLQFDGVEAPLFYLSPGQFNVQVPWELAGRAQTSVTVSNGGATSNVAEVALSPYAPGLFSLSGTGAGQGAVVIANTSLLAAPDRPAERGEYLSIFATGLGPVTNQPSSGMPSPSVPLSMTTTVPDVTIGGIPALVTFSGLAPGFVGLYQVNVQVPPGAPAGGAIQAQLAIGGVTSNTVTIAVR